MKTFKKSAKKNMKVPFIPNPTSEGGSPEVHLPRGLLCAAAVLNDAGVQVCIPGITSRDQTGIVRTPPAPLIQDLDGLPDPRYDLFPSMHLMKSISVEEGRGCPYDCSFCCTNQFWRRNFRIRSVDRIVGLIKKLISNYNIREFSLTHDIFVLSPDRVLRFCEAIKKENLNIRWHCSCRIDRLDDNLLRQMAETGCSCLYFGIETGSERMQKSIGKRLEFPGCVMKNYQSLDISGDGGSGKYERLARIGKFLDVILVRYLGREEHPIREVMRYELAALEIKECNDDEVSTEVKEFSFDIEKFIKKIEISGFKRLPRAPRRERVVLMFVKKDGKIVTARLPDKLAGHSCANPETGECV